MTDRVPPERWGDAQKWERDIWIGMDRGLRSGQGLWTRLATAVGIRRRIIGDDWNRWWCERFDNYASLPTRMENAIELGCGPFTNVRLILERTEIHHLHCSDPLARDYLRLPTSWLSQAVPAGRVMLDDHPAEQCPYASDYFDLVVMVNVLDHVQDADHCMQQAIRIARPGGCLVIGQDLTNAEDAAKFLDVGHPIRLDHAWLDERLLGRFRPVLHRVLPREEGRNPAAHYGTYVFIGQKVE